MMNMIFDRLNDQSVKITYGTVNTTTVSRDYLFHFWKEKIRLTYHKEQKPSNIAMM